LAKAPAKAAAKTGKKKSFKKKEKRVVHVGTVYVQATFNNTIVTIADLEGNTILLVERGFARIPRIAQGHALRRAAGVDDGSLEGKKVGLRTVDVRVSGPGSGRESAIRALATSDLKCVALRTAHRFRTTVAGRPRSGECK
jgi:small subunit ribosomal protein S11